MKMNKISTPHPGTVEAKTFTPWGLRHGHPPSPNKCIWDLKCTNLRVLLIHKSPKAEYGISLKGCHHWLLGTIPSWARTGSSPDELKH